MNLTANFTLEELTRSETAARNGWDNTPNEAEIENLKRLAMLIRNARMLRGGDWLPDQQDGTLVRKIVGLARGRRS